MLYSIVSARRPQLLMPWHLSRGLLAPVPDHQAEQGRYEVERNDGRKQDAALNERLNRVDPLAVPPGTDTARAAYENARLKCATLSTAEAQDACFKQAAEDYKASIQASREK